MCTGGTLVTKVEGKVRVEKQNRNAHIGKGTQIINYESFLRTLFIFEFDAHHLHCVQHDGKALKSIR